MSFRQLRKLREGGAGGRSGERHAVDSSPFSAADQEKQQDVPKQDEDESSQSSADDRLSGHDEGEGEEEAGHRSGRVSGGTVRKKSAFLLYDSDDGGANTSSSSPAVSSSEDTESNGKTVPQASSAARERRELKTPQGMDVSEEQDSAKEKKNSLVRERTPDTTGVDGTLPGNFDVKKKRKKKKKRSSSSVTPSGIAAPSVRPVVKMEEGDDNRKEKTKGQDHEDAPTQDDGAEGDGLSVTKSSGKAGNSTDDEGEEKDPEGESSSSEQEDRNHSSGALGEEARSSYCLFMERGMFNTDNELRRIFGREITRSLGGGDEGTSIAGGGGPGRRLRRLPGAGSASRRRCWLLPDGDSMLLPSSFCHDYVRMVKEEDRTETGESSAHDSNSREKRFKDRRRREETLSESVEFSLQYTPFYEQLQGSFHAVVHAQDPQNLHHFLQRHPGHIDSLLHLSDAYRSQGQHEAATQYSKRALSVLQKSFHPSFSPFIYTAEGLPQVAVDSGNPFNKNLFKCIGLYGAALADHGCYRTALEVSKLLVAMDLHRDAYHAMLHLDYYALRARQWQFLFHFSRCFVQQHLAYVIPLVSLTSEEGDSEGSSGLFGGQSVKEALGETMQISDLTLILPNFAFSSALALFLHGTEGASPKDVKAITAEDLLSICLPFHKPVLDSAQTQLPHLLLMRAVLLFPSFVRRLLQKLAINGSQKVVDSAYSSVSWEQLLFSPPLWDRTTYTHERYGEILGILVSCYVQKAHDMWRSDIALRWLHSCVSHLHQLYQSSPELKNFRKQWSKAVFLFDVSRYKDVRVSEFERIPTLPAFLLDEDAETGLSATRNARRTIRYVSVNSSPILIFLETFLPWTQVDLTGLKAEPKHVSDIVGSCCSLLRQAASALSIAARCLVAASARLVRKLSCADSIPFAGPTMSPHDEVGTQAINETERGA
ncbi:transcriptional repressor tcf25 [Cystoisospora suis]|uniref:Transcriptional repressor tcf25 n=1 Tax=Cystoisospora suis TaxID=483139 RepID=A0A2C6LDE0_9APIC|nr:transcriptional repressor tcf25 [Cystoisospora suis]